MLLFKYKHCYLGLLPLTRCTICCACANSQLSSDMSFLMRGVMHAIHLFRMLDFDSPHSSAMGVTADFALSTLPTELIYAILKYLDTSSLLQIALVNRQLYRLPVSIIWCHIWFGVSSQNTRLMLRKCPSWTPRELGPPHISRSGIRDYVPYDRLASTILRDPRPSSFTLWQIRTLTLSLNTPYLNIRNEDGTFSWCEFGMFTQIYLLGTDKLSGLDLVRLVDLETLTFLDHDQLLRYESRVDTVLSCLESTIRFRIQNGKRPLRIAIFSPQLNTFLKIFNEYRFVAESVEALYALVPRMDINFYELLLKCVSSTRSLVSLTITEGDTPLTAIGSKGPGMLDDVALRRISRRFKRALLANRDIKTLVVTNGLLANLATVEDISNLIPAKAVLGRLSSKT